jgi:hypothetical protein
VIHQCNRILKYNIINGKYDKPRHNNHFTPTMNNNNRQLFIFTSTNVCFSRDLGRLPQKKLRGYSPPANYTDRASDRRLSAKLVPTLADRGCHVVSATTPVLKQAQTDLTLCPWPNANVVMGCKRRNISSGIVTCTRTKGQQ